MSASDGTFATMLNTGSGVPRGNSRDVGYGFACQYQLQNMLLIQISFAFFAVILGNGSVNAWDIGRFGGYSVAVQDQPRAVQPFQTSSCAFAAF